MATFISKSPEATQSLGEQWAQEARPGWIIGLSGDLGAGKTQLVKGLARGLGILEPVRSPTFALAHEYTGGKLRLTHLDFYRLDTPEQIISAGLQIYLEQSEGVTVVEWCERWPELNVIDSKAPRSFPFRWVKIEQTGDKERRITYEDFGD